VKNQMRQFRKSGSVRDEDGNVLIYSAMIPIIKMLVRVAATEIRKNTTNSLTLASSSGAGFGTDLHHQTPNDWVNVLPGARPASATHDYSDAIYCC